MAKATTDTQGAGGVKKIRVKQDMIDFIKTQGMTRALKRAGEIKASGKGGEAEFLEGVKRMYGARRLGEATKTATPPKFNAPAGANKKPAGRMAKSAAPKKSSGISTGLKVAGGVAAAGALIASRGKAAGLASKLSPTVGKALAARKGSSTVANVMQKKLASEGVKVGPKGSFGKPTSAMAKAGKGVGTKSEYAQKAMQDKARAYLASRAVTKTPTTARQLASKPAATAAKPKPKTMPKKKTMAAGLGVSQIKGNTKKTTKK